MSRSLLVSCAIHALILLLALARSPRWDGDAKSSPDELALAAPRAAPTVDVEVVATGGGGGPTRPRDLATTIQPRARRARPVRASAPTGAAEPAPAEPAPEMPPPTETGTMEVSPAVGAAAPAAGTATRGEPTGDGEGDGSGDGFGSGDGSGIGPGSGEMGRELHARVLGNELLDVRAREGIPIVSHDEATALRTRDAFPRLPESVWAEWRPYVVKLEVCVGEDGRVREAVLRSSASARLDPIVRAAVKTWRYQPRVVAGKPSPFCHGVVIKYERW
jgi:outer membrane biosynthesis protein TonB